MSRLSGIIMVVCCCLLCGCATRQSASNPNPSPALRLHFPRIDVYGRYADRVTVDDVRQIRDASLRHPDIKIRPSTIEADEQDQVKVHTEESPVVDRKFVIVDFRARKKNGVWQIDTKSIKVQHGSVAEDQGYPSHIEAADSPL